MIEVEGAALQALRIEVKSFFSNTCLRLPAGRQGRQEVLLKRSVPQT
jgi:hypothetical protein